MGAALLAIIMTGFLVLANSGSRNIISFLKPKMSAEAVAKKSIEYISKNLLQPGQTATLNSVSEEGGLVKISIKIGDRDYDSYATKDGRLLFPEALKMDPGDSQQSGKKTVDINDVNIKGQPFYGDINAPVIIVEWSDYQCPFCKKIEQETMPQLIEDYVNTGKVKIVYKNYQFLGPDSQTAGLAARAVWEVAPNKFYDWHKSIFEKQDGENSGWGNKADVLALTKSLGIDSAKVGQLMTSKATEYQKAIDDDKAEGAAFGINGTPAFIIGEEIISGFVPYTTLKKAVDEAFNNDK